MSRRLVILLCVVGIAAGLYAFHGLAYRASRGGEGVPAYSARRHDPYGTAALLDLLAERRIDADCLEGPRLPRGAHGVLIQVLPLSEPALNMVRGGGPQAFRIPVDHLREWIAEGNTVIQFSREHTPLMASFGLTALGALSLQSVASDIQEHEERGRPPDEMPGELVSADWTARAGELANLRRRHGARLMLRAARRFDLGRPGWHALALDRGQPVAAELRHGKGRFIVVGAPTPVLNGGIEQGDNLEFVLGLVGTGPVLFDEWSHGIGHAGTILGLIQRFGLLGVLFQIVFVVGLYTWSTRGDRADVGLGTVRRRASSEQIQVLGYLYERVLSRRETAARVRHEVHRRLAAGLGGSPADVEAGRVTPKPEQAQDVKRIVDALKAIELAGARKQSESDLAAVLTWSSEFMKENARV